jgi:biopolymer transport protein ExbD
MKIKGRIKLEEGLKQIDLLPLINLIFLLLLFFLFASGFMLQPGIIVNLPKAITSQAINYDNIEVLITPENQIFLNGRPVSLQELALVFKQLNRKNQSLLIKADKQSSLGKAVEIWDIARNCGIAQINIATNP